MRAEAEGTDVRSAKFTPQKGGEIRVGLNRRRAVEARLPPFAASSLRLWTALDVGNPRDSRRLVATLSAEALAPLMRHGEVHSVAGCPEDAHDRLSLL